MKNVNVVNVIFFSLFRFRIYQDAKITFIKDITLNTPGEPIVGKSEGSEGKNLLDLDPSDVVFYVGGYPDTFTVSKQGNKNSNTNHFFMSN